MALGSIGPGQFWEAFSDPGKPWCVTGGMEHDDDLSVSLYFSKRGRLKGVLVYDGEKNEVVAIVGKVPKAEREVASA